MTNFISKIFFLFVLLILSSIQGLTDLEQKNQVQLNKAQLESNKSRQNFSIDPDFGNFPLHFIPNKGQVDERALFYARASKYTLWLTEDGLVFDSSRRLKKKSTKMPKLHPGDENNLAFFEFDRDVSRLVFLNANNRPNVFPLNGTEHRVNYFIGNDPSNWQKDVQASQAILYEELYPNIDLKVYGIEQQIEYDFIVKPGGEIHDIGFKYEDVIETRIDKEGNLIINTEFGKLEHSKPFCFQVIEGERVEVEAQFKKNEKNTYGFEVEEYNENYKLIIDPLVLEYSTFLGGSVGDTGESITIDSTGAIYVTGYTNSLDFPIKSSVQANYGGGRYDAFIVKINASGTALVYSTYLGGSDQEYGRGIAVDSEGAAYALIDTTSIDFPTKNPLQENNGGGYDTTLTKLDSKGNALIYATYLGGTDDDSGRGIAVDSEGAAYVTGEAMSVNFPTKNPIPGVYSGGGSKAFITKINSSGSALVYSSLLGGPDGNGGTDIAVDSKGAAYVTGHTASASFPLKKPIQDRRAGSFITKINATGSALVYSTYLGGTNWGQPYAIAVDSQGAAYVTGWTESTDYPTKNPFQKSLKGERDVYIAKISATGVKLLYSTYLGGSLEEWPYDIAVDSEGSAYVIGQTQSGDFPLQNPIQSSKPGPWSDAFVTKISPSGNTLLYSTYLSGSKGADVHGIAVDAKGKAYVTGVTFSTDFPLKNPLQKKNEGGGDVFVAKLISSEGIRIVSWNILDFSDMNEEPREDYFRSLIDVLNPDILVVQEMGSAGGVSQFLKEVLNSKKPKLYKAASFFDGPDTDNALFYNKTMFKVVSRQQIPTSFRDITEYKIKIKKGTAKGTKFKIYSVHFSEGAGANKERENEALTLRTYLDGLPPNELFLVCGSFNMLSSAEKAFKILAGNRVSNNGRLKDPLNKTGKWQDKSKHRRIHTESTRKSKFGGGAGGGLDSRYDMILLSYGLIDNKTLIYSNGSYSVFGNDGKHLNKAVNKPKNKAVSPEIADALYMASDHLPVVIDLIPVEK
jgi:endonuclease/exonuclease/phosphatase family metal-dependent hydrolase